MPNLLKCGRLALKSMYLAIVLTSGAAAWAQSAPMKIVLTGQSMIRADTRLYAASEVATMAPLLKGDVVFTNFEATVAERGQPNESAPREGNSLAPPEAMDVLKEMGFNMFSLANNHVWDLRVAGVQNAILEANRRNMTHAGTGNTIEEAAGPGFLKTSKGTVALIAMASGGIRPGAPATTNRPGVNELRVESGNIPNEEDSQRILQSIRDASKRADLVIVYQHNHVFGDKAFATLFNEGMPERLAPDPWLVKWTHEEVAAGADIVVMHGAPLLHGVEIFQGRPIFYDLGNFIYNLPSTLTYIDEPIAWESVVARVEFRGRTLQAITLLPIALNPIGEGQPDAHDPHANNEFLRTRGLPSAVSGAKASYIIKRLAKLSEPFGTRVELSGDSGRIVVRPR
jgi:poly-gamma-glutamate capsule biosynthesis protein CapA/YwtB (metallophosphatase superfamily)